jgi:hypothetical protein
VASSLAASTCSQTRLAHSYEEEEEEDVYGPAEMDTCKVLFARMLSKGEQERGRRWDITINTGHRIRPALGLGWVGWDGWGALPNLLPHSNQGLICRAVRET